MRVAFTDLAVLDLQEIGEWLLFSDPKRANQTVSGLRQSCEKLRIYPRIGARMPNGIRKLVIGQFLAFYRMKGPNEIQILHIAHGTQDWATTLRNRI